MILKNNPYLYASFSIIFWGTAATAFKIALKYVKFYELLLWSSFTASIFLICALLVKKEIKLLFTFTIKDYFVSAFLGFLNPFMYYVVLLKAYSLLQAQIAQPLNFLWPLTTVLFSVVILKHKIYARNIIALIVSFLGVAIISSKGSFSLSSIDNLWGVFLAVFSSVIWGLFFIINVRDKRTELHKLTLSFVFGFIYILIYSIVAKFSFPELKGLLSCVYVGFFEMGITFVLWLKALSLSKSLSKISNLIFLTPFLSLIIIGFVLEERILSSSIIGLVIIVIGIFIQNISKSKINQIK